MKKIIIPISNSFFVRNFLRAGFLGLFDQNNTFVFLVPEEKINYYRSEFTGERVQFLAFPRLRFPKVERLFREIETAMIPTKTVYMMHQFHFHRRATRRSFVFRLPIFIFDIALWFIGRFRFAREIFRLVYRSFSESAYRQLLISESPDLLFCPTIVYGTEWVLMREAKRLKVRTIGMTSSWDNLYAKTLLRVKPDQLLLQTELMKETAKKFCDFPAKNIFVTGVPQYDRYFNNRPTLDRKSFIQNLGGDPEKKLILYAFSGKVTHDLDSSFSLMLGREALENRFALPSQILIRPYPKRDFTDEKISRWRQDCNVLVERSTISVGSGKNAWEFDKTALDFLANSLAHADVIVTACSTFLVEAAVFNKPTVSIGFDLEPNIDYWNSAKRFFDWDHLNDLRASRGIYVAKDKSDFFSAINNYLKDPLLDSQGRKEIVFKQCVFTDGQSVRRVAENIKNILS